MGNKQTIPSNIQVLKRQNWIQAGEDQQKVLFSNVNPYRKRLLANIITHQLIEQYELNFIAEEDYNNYVKQLSFRQFSNKRDNNQFRFHSKSDNCFPQFIYPIRYFINKSKNQMCTTIHTGYLYIDKVDLRLKQINDIPYPDLLYIYKATLIGFKFLYQKVGYFDIQQEMIFINRKGEVKVWMNANLAKNYPNFQKNQNATSRQINSNGQNQNLYGSQADMIKDLIYLIQKNSDQHTQQYTTVLFSQYLQTKNILDKLSFQHCIQQFQRYLHQNNLHCSDHMKSIPELFSPDQHLNNNQTNYELSHVNQLTSQRLNQIKKKFEPMETIQEDQKFITSINSQKLNYNNPNNCNNHSIYNISSTNQHHRQFYQNQVSNFTPQKMTSIKEGYNNCQPPLQSQKRNFIGPVPTPYVDLNKSRYSQYSTTNKNQNSNQFMKKSSFSNNANMNNNPNSISQVSYHIDPNIQPVNNNLNHPHTNQLNMVPLNIINSSPNKGAQFVPQFQSGEQNNKIFIISPPPSFRVMGGVNGVTYQPRFHSTIIHHPTVFQSHQPILLGSNIYETHLGPQKQNTVINNQSSKGPMPNFTPQKHKVNIVRQQNVNSPLISYNHASLLPPKYSPHNMQKIEIESASHSKISKQQKNLSKSNLKYFTTKNTYKLDDQIANDLQKFLGLKVN